MLKNGSAAAETSSLATRATSSRDLGPAIANPSRSVVIGRTATPRFGRCASNQRRWNRSAAPEPTIMNRSGPSLATVRSPISRPLGLSMGASAILPSIGQAAGEQPVEPGLGARARDLVLAVVGDLEDARRPRAPPGIRGRPARGHWSGETSAPRARRRPRARTRAHARARTRRRTPRRLRSADRRSAWSGAAGRPAAPRSGR